MSKGKDHSKQFGKYLRGELSPQETHAFERELLDDEFSQDALEGFEDHGPELIEDVSKLKAQVLNNRSTSLVWWRIAAVFAILVVSSLLVFFFSDQWEETSSLASHEDEFLQQVDSAANAGPKKSGSIREELAENEIELHANEQKENEFNSAKTAQSSREIAEDHFAISKKNPETELATNTVLGRSNQMSTEPAASPPEEDLSNLSKIASSGDRELLAEVPEPVITENKVNTRARKEDFINTSRKEKAVKRQTQISAIPTETQIDKPIILPSNTLDQNRGIVGRVTDEQGYPLPGLNVLVKGKNIGTTTDTAGRFYLGDIAAKSLLFSYVGFTNQEVEIVSQDTLNITMTADDMALQEVVVTGYGNATEEALPFMGAKPQIGFSAYRKYLREQVRYPPQALENEVSGTVVLSVQITSTGEVGTITVKKSLGYGCDLEAIRLIKEGPAWVSARRGDLEVDDEVQVKVRFKQ
ncbi:MAG: TonB family protein [Bacteroidota bacterium]